MLSRCLIEATTVSEASEGCGGGRICPEIDGEAGMGDKDGWAKDGGSPVMPDLLGVRIALPERFMG